MNALSERGQRIASALEEIANIGSDVSTLLHAVLHGATLHLAPTLPIETLCGQSHEFSGSLESASRASYFSAQGDLMHVVSELAAKWRDRALAGR